MTNKKDNRPLSPHLQIYKPQISSFSSIFHRITGVSLYGGLIFLCWFLFYNAYYQTMDSGLKCDCPIKQLLLYVIISGMVFALYYHLFNGIRHLLWDAGKGFDKEIATRNGLIVIFTSILFASLTLFYVFAL